ncbi:thiol reductant ABC exporter subunit CydD [Comamonas aquatica]|uniref:thiol reductant ABC exporter subunit CydD n=2 Tax=Comamonas aquatica TaxID=225991 RepID=UPI00244703B8|nr:thiol reductant ABC exporter subunit CydD [Comamonas aquatica]MDH1814775.1 thiol reductant ABC exporter subunit CydD [Comamonas aquatica]
MESTDFDQTASKPRAQRRRPDCGTAWSVVASLLWLPQAALLATAVQWMATGRAAEVGGLALGLLVLGAAKAWCEGHGMRLSFEAARAQLDTLRAQVVQALASSSPLDTRRVPSGQAASAVAEQAEAIVPWLSRYQTAMWRTRVLPLVIAAVVAWQSWVAALILVVAAPLIPLFMAIVGWRAQAASEEQMVQLGQMNGFLLDRLRGLTTLRALGAVDATARRLRAHAESLRQRTLRVLRIAFLSSAVLELFSALGVAMVAVYVGFHLLGYLEFGTWHGRLNLGQALFVLLLAPSFFEPLRELAAVWHDRAAGEAAVQTLQDMARAAQPLPGALAAHAPHALGARQAAARVTLHNVHIQAPGAAASTAPVHLDIQPGEHVALWGASGSGKSVLLAQIAGLLPTHQGQVRVDGVPMEDCNAAALRQRMAWMGQHPHVFAGSAARNIRLDRPDVAEADVAPAMLAAGLGAVLQARPSSSLGEGGQGLSGGEAVRLALARLAVAAPQAGVLLVDEPTAHLDPMTAAQVMQALLQLAQGRTLIVATHDPLLAARMDRVVPVQGAEVLA